MSSMRDKAIEPLAELGQDRLTIVLAEPVLLVQGDDQSLALPGHVEQCLAVGSGQVVIDDEHEQIGASRQLHRLGLAGRALDPGLSQSRRVGQQQGPFHALDGVRMRFAAASCPHRRTGLAHRSAKERVDQRSLADGTGAHHDHMEASTDPELASGDRGLRPGVSPTRAGSRVCWTIFGRAIACVVDHGDGPNPSSRTAGDLLDRSPRRFRPEFGVCDRLLSRCSVQRFPDGKIFSDRRILTLLF